MNKPRTVNFHKKKNVRKLIEDVIEPHPIRSVSLFDAYPELASEWLYSKNCGFGPEDFSYGSGIVVWWKCSGCKKEWRAAISTRSINKSGCFRCNVGEITDLRKYPEALEQFDWKKNKGVDPYKLPWHCKVWWSCKKGRDHKWLSAYQRRKGERCPYCRNHKISRDNLLAKNKKLAKEFHSKLNGDLTPNDISMHSPQAIWWQCSKSKDHVWQASIGRRNLKKSGCPFCINRWPSQTNNLATLHPELAKSWHPKKNKPLKPEDVTAGSHTKVWWKCSAGSDHEWQTQVYLRTSKGTGCPFCCNYRLSKTNCLAKLFPKLAKEWQIKKNGNLRPDQVRATDPKPKWWRCSTCGREWQSSPYKRTKTGSGCLSCAVRKYHRKKKS